MNREHEPAPVDLAAESVAGEEDPGASIDMSQAPMAPGDEAPPGTPGTGEDVCPRCGGSGKLAGTTCPECQGRGKVTVGIGGA
ncbi:hypothetical protein [Ramlibacter albus]|uniref:Molecular chaperone DnaJ n=1 Tax=Ramlibacter albus TaxID=2079448 RepID=A0A923S448_9BURK|nr:hypothetical protein [Ramlibacter albus]MBC5766538.1 hypothetical protein [Ramlibacter albus]